jgi:hypothetical protein
MENIEHHIEKDRQILSNPTTSPQQRRHVEEELGQLERYHTNHPDDDHDPSCLELYCEDHPDADECKVYDD